MEEIHDAFPDTDGRATYAYMVCGNALEITGYDQRLRELINALTDLEKRIEPQERPDIEGRIEFERPWCRAVCPDRVFRTRGKRGDPDTGCRLWFTTYTRGIFKQRAWPLCTCRYGPWFLVEKACADPV